MLFYINWMELIVIIFKSRLIKDNVLYIVKRQCKFNIVLVKMIYSFFVKY